MAPPPEEELRILEAYKRMLEDQLRLIEERIRELRESRRGGQGPPPL